MLKFHTLIDRRVWVHYFWSSLKSKLRLNRWSDKYNGSLYCYFITFQDTNKHGNLVDTQSSAQRHAGPLPPVSGAWDLLHNRDKMHTWRFSCVFFRSISASWHGGDSMWTWSHSKHCGRQCLSTVTEKMASDFNSGSEKVSRGDFFIKSDQNYDLYQWLYKWTCLESLRLIPRLYRNSGQIWSRDLFFFWGDGGGGLAPPSKPAAEGDTPLVPPGGTF